MSKNAITGAFYCTATPLFHPLKALTICPVTLILRQNHAFLSILWELSGDRYCWCGQTRGNRDKDTELNALYKKRQNKSGRQDLNLRPSLRDALI